MKTVEILVLTSVLFSAATSFTQAQPSREQQVQSHSRRAAEYIKENRYEQAVSELKAILVLEPDNAEAHGNLGAVLFFQGAYAEAIPHLRAVLKVRPTLWKTQALLGIAEKRTGEAENARRDLEKAFPNVSESKIRMDTGMELIDIYSTGGDLEQAAALLGTLRKLDPMNEALLYTSYRIYSDLADESLLSLSVVHPNSARLHQAMAHELAKRGKSAEAIENYRTALKLDPALPGLHFELAEMLSTLGTTEGAREAEGEYKSALQANPQDAQAESRLGEIALRANDLQAASEHYNRALQLQPNDAESRIGLARVFLAQAQPLKAEPQLQRALELDPTNATAHYRLSSVYRQTGRAAQAKQEIEEYQKYRKMKEQLRDLYRDLHRDQVVEEDEGSKSVN